MLNPVQFDIGNVNVRMRVNLLQCLSEITKYNQSQNFLNHKCQTLMGALVDSIKEDISSLEERPVLDLVNVLSRLLAQGLRPQTSAKAADLLATVHGVVSDMAVENADLVEASFILDYLNAIKVERRRLDADKTEAFVDMFRAKCQE